MINKTQPLVTIGISTYNRASSYLKQAIRSAVDQTYPNIEIIVSDNCSVDETEMVVKSFNNSHVRYFKQKKNIGANNNFNFCLKQAKGDYFLLLHDDDLIDYDFIEVCMNVVKNDANTGVILTGTRIIDAQGNILAEGPNLFGGLSTEEFFIGWFKDKAPLYLCSTLYNTRRLKELGGFKSKHNLYQDVVATVQLAARFGRVDIQDVKASYRNHPLTRTHTLRVREWCEDSLILLDLICDLASVNKSLIKKIGMKKLSGRNYGRASSIKSPIGRFIAYLIVFKRFNYRYFPSFYHFLYMTSIYHVLRFAKRKIVKSNQTNTFHTL